MSKKSRLDLLVRVRYLNPLPPPPFPPKLFDIPTDISRLGEPSHLSQLASSTPLPMLVDSEMGMPLDLNAYDGVWEGDDSRLNPPLDQSVIVDPEDALLMAPVSAIPTTNGADRPLPSTTEVSWMRTSNLFMRKTQAKRRDAGERMKEDAEADASEAAQLEAIENTFTHIQNQEAAKVKHPNARKRDLYVIESYDVLPDDNFGEVSYVMFRFPDRPSSVTTALNTSTALPTSPRLNRALLYPRDNHGQQEVDYFLPREEDIPRLDDVFQRAVGPEVEEKVEEMTRENATDPRIDEIFPSTHYDRARTYETVNSSLGQKEIILTFEEQSGQGPSKRRKGVYYHDVYMRTLLRKARAKRKDEFEESEAADKVRVGYKQPSEAHRDAQAKASAKMTDPTWADEQLARIQGEADDLMGEAMEDGD